VGGATGRVLTIVGVVGDVRLSSLAAVAEPTVYFSYEQFTLPFMAVVVRTRGDVAAVQSAVRSEARALDRDLPVGEARRLDLVVARSAAQPRFRAVLLSGFALAAVVLAALGVYGIISHAVTQRVREIGIRLALGAMPSEVVRMLLRDGLTLAGIGIAAGIAGALGLGRVIENLLFGVEPTDAATFAAVTAMLLVVAVVAAYIPARRALRVDPMVTLRME